MSVTLATITLLLLLLQLLAPTSCFVPPFRNRLVVVVGRRFADKVQQEPAAAESVEDHDQDVLKLTPKAQFVELCQQFQLSTDGTKVQLLQRLRDYAKEQEKKERKRLEERKKRVEEGTEDDRERFEIVGEEDEDDQDDDDDVYFYYHDASPSNDTDNNKNKKKSSKNPSKQSQSFLTAPPPPVEPNERGERVVTVYSTSDQNDLTGIAAAQPRQAAAGDPMTSSIGGEPQFTPWDTNNPSKNKKEATSLTQIEAAKEEVADLVQSLLAMSGAPAFMQDTDDLTFLGAIRSGSSSSSYDIPSQFTGFHPEDVPTDMLTRASTSLRTGRGDVLRDVLREFELRAVGHDGAFGDDMEKGGGHYRQVTKVRSFLEGFRRAEVRRIARQTATMLLDKLVSEGIEGLDLVLGTMMRSSDDTSDEAGELNDSLLDYLNDVIRQQEKKVGKQVDSAKKVAELNQAVKQEQEDEIEKLWTVETQDGQRIESFDPNEKKTQEILRAEAERQAANTKEEQALLPASAPEKLLLLLKLLRERIKAEAVFSHDEKSRNLRILAYCLKLNSDALRRELITKEFGSTLDRLDSFSELVASSIEYGESTSHQLHPSKQGSLDVPLLKTILALTDEVRKEQRWKASGGTTPRPESRQTP